MGIAVSPLSVIPPDIIAQEHELLPAQISHFWSLAAGDDASVRSFLSRYTGPGSSVTASQCSTTSWGINPLPLGASFLVANATQGSCPFLPVVQELCCPHHPPPPAASRHPDPVGFEAASLSQHSSAPSSGRYPHPSLAYNCGSTRGYPQPIPYVGASYHPFTPVNRGGQGHHVLMDGGGTPFPVPHSGHHGGVPFASFNCQIPSAGVPSYIYGSVAVPGHHGLGGSPHAPSLVASLFGASTSPLRPLTHEDVRSSSDSESPGPLVSRSSLCLHRLSLRFPRSQLWFRFPLSWPCLCQLLLPQLSSLPC
jgi:hypothetical protein